MTPCKIGLEQGFYVQNEKWASEETFFREK